MNAYTNVKAFWVVEFPNENLDETRINPPSYN